MTIHHAKATRQLSRRRSGRDGSGDAGRVDVIYNPSSGIGRPDQGRYLTALHASLSAHFSAVHVHVVSDAPRSSPEELAVAALGEGANNFVAVGGDGTVASVATALRGRPHASLTVAPRGTANAFASALCLPGDAEAVARAAARGRARALDIASVDTASFHGSALLLAGVGLEADAVAETRRLPWLKRVFGAGGYLLAALRCVLWRRSFRARLVLVDVRDADADGRVEAPRLALSNVRLQAVTVANAAPPSSVLAQGLGAVAPDDGLLEVVCVAPRSVFASLVAFADMVRGAMVSRRVVRDGVFGVRARRVEIECEPPQRVVVDGEDAGLTPVVVELGGYMSRVQVVAPAKGALRRRRRRLRRTLERLWRNLRGVGVLAAAVWVVRRYEHARRRGGESESESEREEGFV